MPTDRFPDATASDFSVIGGILYFAGEPIAVLANNGVNYGFINNLEGSLLFRNSDDLTPADESSARSPREDTLTTDVSLTRLEQVTDTPAEGIERQLFAPSSTLLSEQADQAGINLSHTTNSVILTGNEKQHSAVGCPHNRRQFTSQNTECNPSLPR